jgi:structure-specific recognition protein 1
MSLEPKELNLKGWNWGECEVNGNVLEFSVSSKSAFEIPLSDVSNSVVSTKNEVSLELQQNEKNKKLDSLVEIRFYIPDNEENSEEDSAKVHQFSFKELQ